MRLETRVADAQRLEWALRQRIEELERRLRDLGQAPPAPSAAQTERAPVSPASAQGSRRTDGDEFAAVLHASILREQTHASVEPPQGGVQQQRFAVSPQPTTPQRRINSEIHASPAQQGSVPAPQMLPVPPPPAPVESDIDEPVREDETMVKARALLRAGRTIEQVARETGVEIGALRLMKQMTQRD